jgi:hypothetical protein
VTREQGSRALRFIPEPEAPTRIAQQLCQIARGSARLNGEGQVRECHLLLARRVAFDSIPSNRWAYLTGGKLPDSTGSYVKQDLHVLGLVTEKSGNLTDFIKGLLRRAGIDPGLLIH